MDKTELRRKDFITSLLLIAFGLFLIVYTVLEIPMKDSWGGVMNVWYVSPGLFPICIGFLIILMGSVLCLRAIKDGGAKGVLETILSREKRLTEKTFRFMGILLIIFTYVYLYIPRVDYFLSTMLILMVFISFYYLDRPDLLKKFFMFYLAGCLLFLILFVSGIDRSLNQQYLYLTDFLVFVFFLIYLAYSRILIRRDEALRKKWRTSLLMSVLPSLVLIASFKYFLLVPLPVEGVFIEIMNVIRYALR